MENKRYVLGFDFGTLSCRISVIDLRSGRQVFEDSRDYPHGVITGALPDGGSPLENGWALQDPQDYLTVMTQLTQLQVAVSSSKQALQDASSIMGAIRPNK